MYLIFKKPGDSEESYHWEFVILVPKAEKVVDQNKPSIFVNGHPDSNYRPSERNPDNEVILVEYVKKHRFYLDKSQVPVGCFPF